MIAGYGRKKSRNHLKTQRRDLFVHFDAKREIILTCDTSQYGIGAVMSHIMDDGTESELLSDRKRSPGSNLCSKE